MKEDRVSVYASVNVEAETEEQARELAHDMVLNGEVKMRDYEFEAQERD